jgi:hypothetical protein
MRLAALAILLLTVCGCKHDGGGDLSPLLGPKPLSVDQEAGVMRELDSWIGNDKFSAF